MSVGYVIPNESRFQQVDIPLISSFNVPTVGKFDFNKSESFATTAFTVGFAVFAANSSWPVGETVQFGTTGVLPAPLKANTNYYIITNSYYFGVWDLRVSLTPGGAPITFTTVGVGVHTMTPVRTIMALEPNFLYFLERLNIGGNVSQEIYLNSLYSIPTITLKRSLDNQLIFPKTIPVVNYISNQEINGWFVTQRTGDSLICTVAGLLNPTVDLIGIDNVTLNVQFNLYEINDSEYIKRFKEGRGVAGKQTVSNSFYR